jgi:hypothetical protein
MSSRLDALAPFSAWIRSLVHVVTNSYNGSLFFAPKLREPHRLLCPSPLLPRWCGKPRTSDYTSLSLCRVSSLPTREARVRRAPSRRCGIEILHGCPRRTAAASRWIGRSVPHNSPWIRALCRCTTCIDDVRAPGVLGVSSCFPRRFLACCGMHFAQYKR